MALSINWLTKVITIPKADTLLVQSSPTEIRELSINTFRLGLKDIEDDEGMPYLDTHAHNPPVSVGGVTLARVVEIINGYTITFEDGQYAVNLVGANSNIGDNINVNQVSVRSANSAGLTYSKEIEDQSFFEGRIAIDTIDGNSGTQFPVGVLGVPSDSYANASLINQTRELGNRYFLRGSISLPDNNVDLVGGSSVKDTVALLGNCEGCVFHNVTLSGDALGHFTFHDSILENVTNFSGSGDTSALSGTISLVAGNHTLPILFHSCFSSVAGIGTPIIDCNDATNIDLSIRGYAGGLEIKNLSSGTSNISVDLLSGHVKLDSSCTAGVIVVRGTGRITDNSNGATIVTDGLVTSKPQEILEGDQEHDISDSKFRVRHKLTKSLLVEKDYAGPNNLEEDVSLTEPV